MLKPLEGESGESVRHGRQPSAMVRVIILWCTGNISEQNQRAGGGTVFFRRKCVCVCVSCMETHEVFLSRDLGPVAHLYLHLIPSHICNTADRFRENQCYFSLHPGSWPFFHSFLRRYYNFRRKDDTKTEDRGVAWRRQELFRVGLPLLSDSLSFISALKT